MRPPLGLVSLEEDKETRTLSQPCEGTEGRRPSASQEEVGFTRTQPCYHPDLRFSSFQNHEK